VRKLIYLVALAATGTLAWHYPFLFELPLIIAIGGAWWAFFAPNGAQEK